MCIRTEVDNILGKPRILDRIAMADYPRKPKNLEKLVEKHNRLKAEANAKMAENESVELDTLAFTTQKTKHIFEAVSALVQGCQKTKAWMILTRTTQPVHAFAALTVLIISSLVYPALSDDGYTTNTSQIPQSNSKLATLMYLAAFCTHFGTQVWMTFVSGLALYFSLPRHTFGLCQEVLFPKYFALNAALSAATLILYARRGGTTDLLQLCALSACTLLELYVRLYLAPPIVRLMREKNVVEAAAGIGGEVGQLNAGELISRCPHYAALHRSFRSVHVTAAAANVLAMACTCVHLHHLAGRMSGI